MATFQSRRSFLAGAPAGVLGLAGLSPATEAAAASTWQSKEKSDTKLRKMLEARIKLFKGDVGMYVRHIPSRKTVAINADTLFPSASLIKVAIMLSLFDRIEKGELEYHQYFTYDGTYTYTGKNDDILSRYKLGETIRLSKLILLMVTISDNSASKWCQEIAGGGTRINEVLAAHGFTSYRINSNTPGREQESRTWGWGQTTPREMCAALALVREGRAVDQAASDEMYRVLCRAYWNGEALAGIPPWVQAASKQGALDQSRSEAVLVNAPHGDYVFAVTTNNQENRSWTDDNDGFVLLREVSNMLWNYFEPHSGWKPVPKRWKDDR
jgi:beta-lactamase class A